MLSFGALFASCNKENDEVLASKDVTYETEFEEITGNSTLFIKGEYTDKDGKTVTIDEPLPFKLTLKDVPVNQKCKFKGYIFSIKANEIRGEVRMSTSNSKQDLYRGRKQINISTNVSLGFTSEELKAKTSFDFTE